MGQEPQTMQEYKTQREKDWNAYKDIHGILDPGYLTRTDYMDKYDSDHATLIAAIKLQQNSQNEHNQNKQSVSDSSSNDDVDTRDSDHKKNKHNRRRRNKRSKDKQNDNHNNEAANHEKSVNTKKPLQKSAEKRDKADDETEKSDKNKKSENSEKSKENLEAENAKSKDKQESKKVAKSDNPKKNADSSESEELSAQSSTMLDNDQAEVSKESLTAIIHNNKKQNKQNKNDKSALANLDKRLNSKSDKSESATSYLRDFPREVKDYAIKKVGEMARSKGFLGDLKLIDDLSKNQTNLVAIYIMSQMDDEYFNNCSNRTDISDQLIEAARAVRSVKKSQETAKKPPMARDAKRAKEYSRDTYYLVEEILRLLALQFGTTKLKFQAGETDVAEGSISEMNKINFNKDFVKSMMVALQQQTQADLEKARLRKGSNSITTTGGYDELI